MYKVTAIEGKDRFKTTIYVEADSPATAKVEAEAYIGRNTPRPLVGDIQILDILKVDAVVNYRTIDIGRDTSCPECSITT